MRSLASIISRVSTAAVSPSAAHAADYRIVHSYPHDQHAFTQGLVYIDGHLYESTGIKANPLFAKRISKPGAFSACSLYPISISPRALPIGKTRSYNSHGSHTSRSFTIAPPSA